MITYQFLIIVGVLFYIVGAIYSKDSGSFDHVFFYTLGSIWFFAGLLAMYFTLKG